jgi:hypothetical protein
MKNSSLNFSAFEDDINMLSGNVGDLPPREAALYPTKKFSIFDFWEIIPDDNVIFY